MARSCASDPCVIGQPPLSGPMRFSLGTRTSVKNTSLKSQNSLSESSGNGRRSTPGAVVSMMSALMPLCLGAAGSVRTKHRHQSAWCAPDVHTFCPFTTNSSPISSARVDRLARSLPAPGRSEEHTSELQSHLNLVCRLLLEKKKKEQPRTDTK